LGWSDHPKERKNSGRAGDRESEKPFVLSLSKDEQLPVTRHTSLSEGTEQMLKRVAVEIGMGTDIRGADYTKAAVRALRDALWHNSLNVADALGKPTDSMVVEVLIGVPKPDKVDTAQVLAVLPHGTGTVKVVEGGLEIVNDAGTGSTVMASAAAIVRLDL